MSHMIWSSAIVPPSEQSPETVEPNFYKDQGIRLENVLPLRSANTDYPIPDPRAYRSMSRVAVLMSQPCLESESLLRPYLEKNSFSVGLYCAIETGPIDYPSTYELGTVSPDDFPEKYRKLRSPKMYLKQLPNLAPAQIGIFLKIQGPMGCYNHSTAGSVQALEQAEEDLYSGLIDAALVCSGLSFEDDLLTMRSQIETPKEKILCEGAAALLLVPNGVRTPWAQNLVSDPKRYFGIADPIVQLALKEKQRSSHHV
jgi:3-oxoacyl-(acyl-carrier-protein) synthase